MRPKQVRIERLIGDQERFEIILEEISDGLKQIIAIQNAMIRKLNGWPEHLEGMCEGRAIHGEIVDLKTAEIVLASR